MMMPNKQETNKTQGKGRRSVWKQYTLKHIYTKGTPCVSNDFIIFHTIILFFDVSSTYIKQHILHNDTKYVDVYGGIIDEVRDLGFRD